MTKDQFSFLLSSIQQAELQVREDGHKEYAYSDSNVFANFDRVAGSLSIDRKRVLLVYALKHWDGIISYINGHVSQREDVRGRIKDLRMYLALLWGMIEEEDPIKPIISVDEARSILLGPECSHEQGCGCEKESIVPGQVLEVTTHADGPDNRKFIHYIRG